MHRPRRPTLPRPPRRVHAPDGSPGPDERGVALATAVVIVTIVFMLLAAVVLPIASDQATALRSRHLAEGRALADTVLNELFAEIAASPEAEPVLAGRVSPGVQVSAAGPTGGWAHWDTATNAAVPCPSVEAACYYYAIRTPARVAADASATAIDDYALAEVTVRTGCTRTGDRCVQRRVQQRLKRRRLLDYALFTDYETLKPGLYATAEENEWAALNCGRRADANNLSSPPRLAPDGTPYRDGACAEVVFIGFGADVSNLVRGPIHTNDPQFWVCGAPSFTGRVEATGDQPLVAFPLGGCVDQASAPSVVKAPVIPLPTSVTEFEAITPAPYRLVGPVTVALDDSMMSITDGVGTRTMAVPRRGIVYVTGPLSLYGAGRDVTFVSTGSIRIIGNLTTAGGGEGSNIGLVAAEDVILDVPRDLTVHASLLASNGSVYNERFRQPVSGVPPKLTVRGAIVARYHPVSGLFEPGTGALVSGMVSDLAYSSPAPNPPYFLEPVQAQWERVDYTEVRLNDDALSEGLTPRPLSGLPPAAPGCTAPAPAPYAGTWLRGCLRTP